MQRVLKRLILIISLSKPPPSSQVPSTVTVQPTRPTSKVAPTTDNKMAPPSSSGAVTGSGASAVPSGTSGKSFYLYMLHDLYRVLR